MRQRHGTVSQSGSGWAVVNVDGELLDAHTHSGSALGVGTPAVILQDGRRLVAAGSVTGPSCRPVDYYTRPTALSASTTLLVPASRYDGTAVTRATYAASTPVASVVQSSSPGTKAVAPGVAGQALDSAQHVLACTRTTAEGATSGSFIATRGQMVLIVGYGFSVTTTDPAVVFRRSAVGAGTNPFVWRCAVEDVETFTVTVPEGSVALVSLVNGADNHTGPQTAGTFTIDAAESVTSWGAVPSDPTYDSCLSLFCASGRSFINLSNQGFPVTGMRFGAGSTFTNLAEPEWAGVNPGTPTTWYGSFSTWAAGQWLADSGDTADTVEGYTWANAPIRGQWVVVRAQQW